MLSSRLLVSVALVCFLSFASAHHNGATVRRCPANGDIVDCDGFFQSPFCWDHCCISSGECSASSCQAVLDLPQALNCGNGQTGCTELRCKPAVDSCVPTVNSKCLGYVECLTANCGGMKANDYCLYDGGSNNFKVCAVQECPPPGVDGDPQFVGLRGQSYQVHGVAGEVYNIVSDADLQYNSRFVFLDRGDCPVINGQKLPGCYSHPGSYLGELGLKTRTGDRIKIVSGPAADGFAAIELNGRYLDIGENVDLAGSIGSIVRINTHQVQVKVGIWEFVFENSDRFINQRVKVTDSRQLRSHGLLGQTWRDTVYPNPIKYIQGAVDDYVIREGDLFGSNFLYNMHD